MKINKFPDFAEYPGDEFQINNYSTGEKGKPGITGWAITVKHLPSGKVSRSISSKDTPPVEYPVPVLVNELVEELRAAGIVPQPRKIGVKKLGKPRWGEVDKQR